MMQPARRKYRKEQKGRNTGVATRGAAVSFGDFGLKAGLPWDPSESSDHGRSRFRCGRRCLTTRLLAKHGHNVSGRRLFVCHDVRTA